jgi:hypothetical protein
MSRDTAHTLLVLYSAIVRAVSVATGQPVEHLANQFIRDLLSDRTPPDALALLQIMSRDEPWPKRKRRRQTAYPQMKPLRG